MVFLWQGESDENHRPAPRESVVLGIYYHKKSVFTTYPVRCVFHPDGMDETFIWLQRQKISLSLVPNQCDYSHRFKRIKTIQGL